MAIKRTSEGFMNTVRSGRCSNLKFLYVLIGIMLLVSCNQNRNVAIKVALVYKTGPQPVARTKFYLMRSDITQEKAKYGDGKMGDNFYMSPGGARMINQIDPGSDPKRPTIPGIKEDYINDFVVDSITSDFEGNAKFENVSPGTYWIIGYTEARAKDQHIVWNLKLEVNVKSPKGTEPILLDQNNAYKVESY